MQHAQMVDLIVGIDDSCQSIYVKQVTSI